MTVFSWDLKINGQSVNVPFGGLKFTHQLSGFGTSGVVTGQFEFDIYDKYDQYGEALLERIPAQLFSRTNSGVFSRVYYIAKRSISKKICHFTAYDLVGLDEEFDMSALHPDKNIEYFPIGNILDAVKNQCGFEYITVTYDEINNIHFTEEMLKGKTCRNILETVSEAMCGIWCNSGYGGVQLICLDTSREAYYTSGSCTEYSEIDYQGRQKITKLIAVNSDTGRTVEHSTGEYGTVIKIESPFVACENGTDSYVWDRIQGLIYQGWKCDKALMDVKRNAKVFNTVSSFFTFGEDVELLANQIRFDVDSTGIYFSGGADPQSDEIWKYEDYLTRTKISVDKLIGNAKMSNNGRISFVNRNKEGDTHG